MPIFSAQMKGKKGDFCAQDDITASSVSPSHNVKILTTTFLREVNHRERKRKWKRAKFLHPHCALNEPIVVGCNELTISTWGFFLFCVWDKASLCERPKVEYYCCGFKAGLRALRDRWGETEHDKKKEKWNEKSQNSNMRWSTIAMDQSGVMWRMLKDLPVSTDVITHLHD